MPLPKKPSKKIAKKAVNSKPPKKLVYILQEDEDEKPAKPAKKKLPPKLA